MVEFRRGEIIEVYHRPIIIFNGFCVTLYSIEINGNTNMGEWRTF
jgi:hypothetical protein